MAGDWIKVEKASSHKPEVLKIARMLGVSRQHAFGLLVEFWAWLDANCVDGVVDGVVDADVDALMSCDGLSALLKLVGWVEFDADPLRMRVVNFDRHNGESSKNRALKSERQAKWRAKTVDAHVDATPSTREEKRRVTNIEREKLDAPTKEHEQIARERGLSVVDEFQKYIDWQASTGKTHKSQTAGFRNWLKNAKQYAPRPGVVGKPNQHDKRAATAAAMFGPLGAVNDEPNDITAESTRVA